MTIDIVFFQRGISEEQIVLKFVFFYQEKEILIKIISWGPLIELIWNDHICMFVCYI